MSRLCWAAGFDPAGNRSPALRALEWGVGHLRSEHSSYNFEVLSPVDARCKGDGKSLPHQISADRPDGIPIGLPAWSCEECE